MKKSKVGMRKSTIYGDCPLLERLTNDEFLEIFQHLSLEQYVLTQVFIPKKKWTPLLDANLHTLQTKCCVCNKQIRLEDMEGHIKQNDHLMLLRSKVKQFFHPFFTYGKIDIKLARGEDTSYDLRENALREANMQIESFKKEWIYAKQISAAAERRSRGIEEEQLIEKYLGRKIYSPDEMIVLANLPFEDISKLLFCVINNEWQTVFSFKNLTKKSTLRCKICSVNCCGIESLNSHLYGRAHNQRQLESYALCYEDSSRVNKNCCIQFGNSFSFSVKNYAMNSYRNIEKNDCDSWISKLPNDVAKKLKPLNEYAIQIFACQESGMNQSNTTKDYNSGLASLDTNDNLGHVGVEYVLKIMKNENDGDPEFECALCEFFGDGHKMQRHILFFDHKKKYLELHYCDTIKKYESLIGGICNKEFLAVMREIVHKVAMEIEKHHSRSLPYTVSSADYKYGRRDIIADVYALLHASQIRGPSFSNVVSKERISYLKNIANQLSSRETFEYPRNILFTIPPKGKIYLNQMSHDPVIRLREYNAKFKTNLSSRTNRSFSPARDNVDNRGDSRFEGSHAPLVYHHHSRSRSPIQERPKTFVRISDGDFYSPNENIWDIYRREIALSANKIEIDYENFRKNPESHPFYEDEWNNFWQRRKKELEREGYDHRSYNFQPEWVQYFKQRIEVLFGEALHKSQIDIRSRLHIPLDAEEDCQRPAQVTNEHIVHHQNRKSGKVDEKDANLNIRNAGKRFPDLKSCNHPQNKRMLLGERKEDLSSYKSHMIISKINDNHSNVIHVLRLMTALEEHLGSLGGKIMDLLSNALQLEKYYTGSRDMFEARILTSSNCNLLETAMEKLKGILFAGLLDEKKLSGFNRVITYTANLLKYAEKMGWRQETNLLFDKKDFISSSKSMGVQEQRHDVRASIGGQVCRKPSGKTLSDTLMDFAKARQENKQHSAGNHSNQHMILPICPPPPNIQEQTMSTNLYVGFKGQTQNSGLASFDTKLSLDQAHHSRAVRQVQPSQTEIGQLQRKIISGRNNVYNNSFKNNNETRTNIVSCTSNGSSSRFLISKIIPRKGQNDIMYHGLDGDE